MPCAAGEGQADSIVQNSFPNVLPGPLVIGQIWDCDCATDLPNFQPLILFNMLHSYVSCAMCYISFCFYVGFFLIKQYCHKSYCFTCNVLCVTCYVICVLCVV